MPHILKKLYDFVKNSTHTLRNEPLINKNPVLTLFKPVEPAKKFRKYSDDPLQNILINIVRLQSEKNIIDGIYSETTNACLAMHLVFYYLQKSMDLENINLVITEMLNISPVRRKLHEFPWDCQGLPQMIRGLIRCCTLYKQEKDLDNYTANQLRETCKDGVRLFDDLLMPLIKRKNELEEAQKHMFISTGVFSENEKRAFNDKYEKEREAHRRIAQIQGELLISFCDIIDYFVDKWPRSLENPLKVFCGQIPQIIADIDIEEDIIKDGLQKFALRIPASIAAFRDSNGEEWKRIVQSLCTKDASGVSPLCRIWELLEKKSKDEAYAFLKSLIQSIVGGLLKSTSKGEVELGFEEHIAKTVTGDIYNLLIECYSHLNIDKDLWGQYINAEVATLLSRNGAIMQQKCPGMYSSLCLIIKIVMDTKEPGDPVMTDKIKVLFLAANPKDTRRIALDEEINEIEKKIRQSPFRDSLIMVCQLAASYDDFQNSLLQHKPHIVHFGCHGTMSNEIILSKDGFTERVSGDSLKRIFGILKDNLRGVILNACYSSTQAEAIIQVIDFAIGIPKEIRDSEAKLFAASFYRAIGYGRVIQDAFDLGIASLKQMGATDNNLPLLLVRTGVDPTKLRLLSPTEEEQW